MFKPNDVVVCIKHWDPKRFNWGPFEFISHYGLPKEGSIYTVLASSDWCPCGTRMPLVEVPNWVVNFPLPGITTKCGISGISYTHDLKRDCGWPSENFRKVTSTGVLEGKEFSVPLPTTIEKSFPEKLRETMEILKIQ